MLLSKATQSVDRLQDLTSLQKRIADENLSPQSPSLNIKEDHSIKVVRDTKKISQSFTQGGSLCG